MRLRSGAAGVRGDACVSANVQGLIVGMLLPSLTPRARALVRIWGPGPSLPALGGAGYAGPWWAESLERGQEEQKSAALVPACPPRQVSPAGLLSLEG